MEEKEPKITGVGGIFFKCDDPKALREWYGSTFGLDYNDYGIQFQSRSLESPEQKEYLQWSTFSKDSDYMQKEYMINYRVQNIEKLIENMRAAGVTICDELETYEYGKFIHVLDLEGNKMELWEPIDTTFMDESEKD